MKYKKSKGEFSFFPHLFFLILEKKSTNQQTNNNNKNNRRRRRKSMGVVKKLVAGLCMAAVASMTLLSRSVSAGRVTQESLVDGFNPKGWFTTGDAFYNSNLVRLVPDRQSKRGGFWSTIPTDYSDWEVEFGMHIHGASAIGADGLAFWYVREPSTGSLFGNDELFTGLGVIVDTYDNENSGIHPYMFAINNDGHHGFDFQDHDHLRDHVPAGRDAAEIFGELNGCTAKIRNTKKPVTVIVKYLDKRLTVNYRVDSEETQCFAIPQITLPTGYFFGFTAATGDLADDHDITYIKVTDLKDTMQSLDTYLAQSNTGSNGAAAGAAISGQGGAGVAQISDKLNQMVNVISNAVKSAKNRQNAPASMQNARGNTLDNKLTGVGSSVKGAKESANKIDSQMATIGSIVNKMKVVSGAEAQNKGGNGKAVRNHPVYPNQPKGSFFFRLVLILGLVGAVGAAAYYYMKLKEEKSRKLL